MSSEPEQIGELIYQPNPDYPYPFPVPLPPHFWMTEQTGKLSEAVEAYMDGEGLDPKHIEYIRQYLRQYVERAILTGDAKRPRLVQEIDTLKGRRDIERYTENLADFGIEPL